MQIDADEMVVFAHGQQVKKFYGTTTKSKPAAAILSPNPAARRADPPSALNNSFGPTNGGVEKQASAEKQFKSRRTGYTYEQLSVLISQKQDNSFEEEVSPSKKSRPSNKSGEQWWETPIAKNQPNSATLVPNQGLLKHRKANEETGKISKPANRQQSHKPIVSSKNIAAGTQKPAKPSDNSF